MIQICIGYDSKEVVAYHALVESILQHASQPVAITALKADALAGVFTRERHPLQSTEFAFTRFLTPYLANYTGWSLFLDCDMVVLRDIAELWALRDERHAVQVVKHRYEPPENTKFLGQVQTRYEKKNWSSVMLFNNSRCRALTPQYVAAASGLELHQFKWLASDDEIGALPAPWNVLVGHDAEPDPALLHFTTGGPYFAAYRNTEFAERWHHYHRLANHVVER
jgi:lipopolysaccharide biosynthesis glycosyltransferase